MFKCDTSQFGQGVSNRSWRLLQMLLALGVVVCTFSEVERREQSEHLTHLRYRVVYAARMHSPRHSSLTVGRETDERHHEQAGPLAEYLLGSWMGK